MEKCFRVHFTFTDPRDRFHTFGESSVYVLAADDEDAIKAATSSVKDKGFGYTITNILNVFEVTEDEYNNHLKLADLLKSQESGRIRWNQKLRELTGREEPKPPAFPPIAIGESSRWKFWKK